MILLLKGMVTGYTRRGGVKVSAHFRRADQIAERAHAGQYRKGAGKIPYITHPRAVVDILHDEAGIRDKQTLIAALLHDTMEDTGMTHAAIAARFGGVVADTVSELTNAPDLLPGTKTAWQVAHAAQMSERACNIKVADKTANLRDIIATPPDWANAKKRQYFEDAKQVVAAMKHKNDTLTQIFANTYLTGINKI